MIERERERERDGGRERQTDRLMEGRMMEGQFMSKKLLLRLAVV